MPPVQVVAGADIPTISTIDEPYGGLVEREGKFAKRVVYAVHRM